MSSLIALRMNVINDRFFWLITLWIRHSLTPVLGLGFIALGLRRRRHLLAGRGIVVALGLLCTTAGPALAQTWTGGAGNGDWSNNGNWSGTMGITSGANTTITFGANNQTNTTQNHTNPFVLNSLTFDDTAAFTINPGDPLRFEMGGTPAVGPQVFNNGTRIQTIKVPIKINAPELLLGGSGIGLMLFDQPIDQVGGDRAVKIQGSGAYSLGADNVQNLYKGGTTLLAGTLVIGNDQALGPSGTLKLGGGTIRALGDRAAGFTIGNPVSLDGNVTFGQGGDTSPLNFSGMSRLTGNRTLTAKGSVTTFRSGIQETAMGTALTVKGDAERTADGLIGGRFKLGGKNTRITGAMTVESGGAWILTRGADARFPAGLEIKAGGFLGGQGGLIGRAVLTGIVRFNRGTFKCPEDGSLDVEGGVEFESGSVFAADIAGLIPGDGYTQLNVTMGLGLIDPGAILDINPIVPLNIGNKFDIMTRDAAPPSGMNMFSDINGMSLLEGIPFTAAGHQWRINYGAIPGGPDTGGNSVRLTVVPEPAVGALPVAVVALRAVARRRCAANRQA